jgi:pimeloyl-ACP methyl ester carboxylesterase
VADEMLPKLLGDTTRRQRPDLTARVRGLILASPTEAIAGAVRALMTRPDSTPTLAAIHVPTLVVVGREDSVTPPAAAEALHAGIAGSAIVVIPEAGHLTSLEQPAAFNAALAHFLDHRV